MKRAAVTALICACLLTAGSPPVQAASVDEALVAQLYAQGYHSVQVSRTFLGRVKINAVLGDLRREIVVNPHTGEILRDYQTEVNRFAGRGSSGETGSSSTVTRSTPSKGGISVPDIVDRSGGSDRPDRSGPGAGKGGAGTASSGGGETVGDVP